MKPLLAVVAGFVFAILVSRFLRLTGMSPRILAAITLPVIAIIAYPAVKRQVKVSFYGWVGIWTLCAFASFVAQAIWK